ncbi:hypothetical protein BKA64DRAFT_769422 [Cadophora sp. MPI-SDFR-AT-0126]|nr:hypothetical protein BKA64DRAFT_769422 [Leotiomycetes sp. MPI-SDFR-AT-0126]
MSADVSDQKVLAQGSEKQQPNTPNPSPTVHKLFLGDLGEETVTLHVGPKRKAFLVHKKLICQSVDYFDKAFNSSFKEGAEGVMYLSDDNQDAVGLFVHWLYRKELPIENTQSHLNNLADAYIFAHKICLTTLKDKIMNTIQTMTLNFSLVDKHFIPFTAKVWTSTEDLRGGLKLFCVYIIVHGMVLRSIKFGQGGLKIRKIGDNDERLMWDLGQASFKLFKGLLRVLEHELQICLHLGDLSIRRKAFLEDGSPCFFHCHKWGDLCILEPEENEKGKMSSFLEDV